MTPTQSPDRTSTITFHFANGLSPAEAAIMARAMAELIKLQPDKATWSYSIECTPKAAYELGLTTAKLVAALTNPER